MEPRPDTEQRSLSTSTNAVNVGRGALFIAAAKLVFMGTGAVVNLALGTLLIPEHYGDYGVTIRWISLLNMMVVQGLMQGVSRAVSAAPGAAGVLRDQALRTVIAVATSAAGLVVVAAWPLSLLLQDERLSPLLMTGASITFSYAFYAAVVGVVNGLQRFRMQALLDMGFSITKMCCILGGAALGLGAVGSVGGFGLAAAIMVAVAWWSVRGLPRETPSTPLTARSLMSFGGWVMAYQAALSLLMLVDLGLVRRAVSTGMLPPESAGFYNGAINLAQLPYYACTAITFVVFPMVGRSSAQGDKEASTAAVHGAIRYALLIMVPLATALVAVGPGVLTAIFPATYVVASEPLRILALSYLLAAASSVVCTLLNALGHPHQSALATAAGVVVTLVSGMLLLPGLGMPGPALGSLLGMATCLFLGARALTRGGMAHWPLASMARQAVAAGVVVLAATVVPWPAIPGRWVGLVAAAACACGSLVLLIPLGELTRADLQMIQRVLGRPGKPNPT